MNSLFNSRLTNEKTCTFQDVIFLDLVDLDRNPNNRIVLETSFPEKMVYYSCPHSLVSTVTKIIISEIKKRNLIDPNAQAEQAMKLKMEKLNKAQEELAKKLDSIQEILKDNKQRRD